MPSRREFLTTAAALPAGLALAQPPAPVSEPVPFRYVIQNVTLHARGQVVINDTFQTRTAFGPPALLSRAAPGVAYKVNLGRIGVPEIRAGSLTITEANTAPIWNGYIAMLTLPAGPNGQYTFTEKDLPLTLSATVLNPKPGPADHLIIGFMDNATLHAVAAASLGRVWGPFPPGFPGGGGGGGGKENWKEIDVINPDPGAVAVSLMRQEQPQVPGDIILNRQTIATAAPAVEMSVSVNAGGAMALSARVAEAGRALAAARTLSLQPRELQPAAFYNSRMKVDFAQTKGLSAVVFAKVMPKARILMVDPQVVSKANASAPLQLMIHGVGFGMDSKVELIPAAGGGQAAKITGVQVGRDNMALRGQVTFPTGGASAYSVRVTTGGQVVSSSSVLRIES